MTDKEPTQEQIKEFWEWCGFKQLPKDIFYLAPNGTPYYDFQRREVLPAIDLNNLFKYAVPKLYRFWLTRTDNNRAFKFEFTWGDADGFTYYHTEASNPTLALFWAIWEVVHAGQ